MDIMAAEEKFGTIQANEVDCSRLILVDMREVNEWEAGHAPDAVHVPLGSVLAGWMPQDLDVTPPAACRSGARSARAAGEMGVVL